MRRKTSPGISKDWVPLALVSGAWSSAFQAESSVPPLSETVSQNGLSWSNVLPQTV